LAPIARHQQRAGVRCAVVEDGVDGAVVGGGEFGERFPPLGDMSVLADGVI
jgi:hypothetical protein